VSRVGGILPIEVHLGLLLVHLIQGAVVDHVVDVGEVRAMRGRGWRNGVVRSEILVAQSLGNIHVAVTRIILAQVAGGAQQSLDGVFTTSGKRGSNSGVLGSLLAGGGTRL